MKIIAVIDKAKITEKILSHLGLWVEDERGPPPEIKHVDYEEVTREPFLDACPEQPAGWPEGVEGIGL